MVKEFITFVGYRLIAENNIPLNDYPDEISEEYREAEDFESELECEHGDPSNESWIR